MTIDKNIEDAAKKFNLDVNYLRSISPQEILYLVDHCPFLQIVCADPKMPGHSAEILTATTGWKIHFYGDAMSSSPGHLLFNSDGGGKGTLTKQAWDTATEMVEIAKNHGWSSINLADAHPLMARALWISAEKMNIPLTGFTPTEHDKQVRKQLALSPNDFEVLIKEIQLRK
jgi:hypothetical protein